MKRVSVVAGMLLSLVLTRTAHAEEEPSPSRDDVAPGPPAVAPAPALAAPGEAKPETKPKLEVTPLGYVEVYYAYNFNRPSNGVTNFRGFDNRHNTFSLSNAAIGSTFDYASTVGGKLIVQIGPTGASYYGSEPVRPGAAGANATGPELWRYLQEAYLTYKPSFGDDRRPLTILAGLHASPIGFEAFAVKDHWTWSRSNLFFGFPYYHAGVRAEYELSETISATAGVYNGWNSVVDNNEEKSVEAHVTYHLGERFLARLLYFGGVERPTGSPEGPWWRHHFDAVVQGEITSRISAAVQADYGFEPNRIGTSRWWALAAAARVKIVPWLAFVYRADRFTEHLATDGEGRSSTPLFWNGSEWITSSTSTLDFRPISDHLSIRLEHRFDLSESALFFRSNVQGDGSATAPFVPNSRYQETVLLGATAWF